MTPIRAVCFDLDGTLYDLKKQQRKLWKSILRHPIVLHHWQRETAAMRGVRSDSIHQDIAQAVAKKTGRTTKKTAAIIQQAIFVDYPSTFRPTDLTPGLTGIFRELDRRKIPRAVVSDHPTDDKLRGLNLLEGWLTRIDCSHLGALKPLPDGLQAVAHLLQCSTENLLLIGDREDTDGEMAVAAGAQSLIRGRDWTTGDELAEHLYKILGIS
ncbi:MAG: HAD family hydrolase [Myxococcota bacterium]|jgi:phosphoglycolate phosphatase/putative hydrolase of the HAD superfamily|nr:HAD family hydrolase [Myxococcota bacterium]